MYHPCRYNTYTQIISEVAPMPEPRARFAAAAWDGNIYVMSGLTTGELGCASAPQHLSPYM
jgi:hypothetical protein